MTGNIEITSEQYQFLINKYKAITWKGIEEVLGIKLPKNSKVKIKRTNKNIGELKFLLRYNKIEFVEEYKFHPKRKFRFDIALPEKMIAIEYDGIICEKSRHLTITGFSGDQEKINIATAMGWKVLRYSPLNFTNVIGDLKSMIK